jgi:hypothetical protein
MSRRDGVDLIHVAGLAIKRHRHDGASPRRNGGLDPGRVDVGRAFLDIREYGLRAEKHNHLRGRDEGERRGDDLVAGPDLQRHERDQQGFGPGSDAHAVLGAGVSRETLLELAHLGPENELTVLEHPLHPRVDLRPKHPVLRLDIGEFH